MRRLVVGTVRCIIPAIYGDAVLARYDDIKTYLFFNCT